MGSSDSNAICQNRISNNTHMFENAENFTVTNSTLNAVGRDLIYNINTDQFRGLYRLYKSVSTSAIYNSEIEYPSGRCHEGTRESVLSRLSHWVTDPDRDSKICWLYGSAGVGKSSVAHTMAERFASQGKLAASFFFWRSDPARNNARCLFPTIALQIANVAPMLRSAINSVVESDFMVLDAPLEDQFRELILQPFSENLDDSEPESPLLVILDGLDECTDGRSQERVLLTIANGLNQCRIPLVFLVTSRPEPRIRKIFELLASRQICSQIGLEDSDADIRKYLSDGFAEIYSRRLVNMGHSICQPWPTPRQLDDLVYKASGQFIFASTILKFVDDDYSMPTERLRVILGLAAPEESGEVADTTVTFDDTGDTIDDRPFRELDVLYQGILSANPNTRQLVRILGSVVVFHEIITPTTRMLEELLALQPGAVSAALSGMHSVLKVVPDLIHMPPQLDSIEFAHKSFSDFLVDPNRSGKFFIDRSIHHNYMACRCLRVMQEKSLLPSFARRMQVWGLRPLVRLKPFTYALGQDLVYHCNWAYHCVSAAINPELIRELRATDVYAYATRLCMVGPELYHSVWKSIEQVGIFIGEVSRVKDWAKSIAVPPQDVIQHFHNFSSLGFNVSFAAAYHDWKEHLTTLGYFLAFNAVIAELDLGFELYTSEKVFCQIMGCGELQLSDLKNISPLRFSARDSQLTEMQGHRTELIDLLDCHATLAVRCIETLMHDSDSFLYAERYWSKHLCRACPRQDLVECLGKYVCSGRLDNNPESIKDAMQWLKGLPLEVHSSATRMLATTLENITNPKPLEIKDFEYHQAEMNSDTESNEDVFFDCED